MHFPTHKKKKKMHFFLLRARFEFWVLGERLVHLGINSRQDKASVDANLGGTPLSFMEKA